MDVKRRLGLLLAGTVLGTSILVSAPAFADDAQLQQQIMPCSGSCRRCRRSWLRPRSRPRRPRSRRNRPNRRSKQQAQNLPANIPPNLYNADVPVPTKGPPSWFDSIHVSMAGTFIAMEGAWRQRNENSSGASDPAFSTIPLLNSPLYNENEMRFSAQQSRIALKAIGRHRSGPPRHGLLRNGLSRCRADGELA